MSKKPLTKEQLNESIARAKNEIRQGENYINQLSKKNMKLERNQRTHRLIQRGAIAESLIDCAEEITNEQFKTLLQAGLRTGAAREVLTFFKKGLSETAQNATTGAD